jgi:hypothetical protein
VKKMKTKQIAPWGRARRSYTSLTSMPATFDLCLTRKK